MKLFKQLIAASVLGSVALASSASFASPVLSFNNAGSNVAQSYHVGDTVSLDFWISGLTGSDDTGGLDLGAFDLNLSFDGAVTGYQNTVFGSDLDDSIFYGLAATPTSGNSVNFFGLSLLADLSAQADQLKLFTLTFTANQAGTSLVKLDNSLLSSSWFTAIDADSFTAEITVANAPVSVPEPGTFGLLLASLALLALGRRKA